MAVVGYPAHGVGGDRTHADIVHTGHTRVGHGGVVDGIVVDVLLSIVVVGHTGDITLIVAGIFPIDIAHRTEVGLEVETAAARCTRIARDGAEGYIRIGGSRDRRWLINGDTAAVLIARIVLNDATADHSTALEVEATAGIVSRIVLDDTVADIAIIRHHGGTADLSLKQRACGLPVLDIKAVEHGVSKRRDGLYLRALAPRGMRLRQHVAEKLGLRGTVIGRLRHRLTILIEDTVGECHHMVGVDCLVATGEDTRKQRLVGDGVTGFEVLCPAALHLHAVRHLDAVQTRVVVLVAFIDSGARRGVAATSFRTIILSQLHDDACRGVVVFIASGSVQNLLQLRTAGGIGRTVGRGVTGLITILRDVVGSDRPIIFRRLCRCVGSGIIAEFLCRHFRLNLAGTIELISALVDGAVLDTGSAGDVLSHLQCLGELRAISLRPHVDAILSKVGSWIDAVRVVGVIISAPISVSTIFAFIE